MQEPSTLQFASWLSLAFIGGLAASLVFRKLVPSSKAREHCQIPARVRFMINHSVEGHIEGGDQILIHSPDRQAFAEKEIELRDINNKVLIFTAKDGDHVIAQKRVMVSVKSSHFYNDDHLALDLTGKDAGTTSSYRSMIVEGR